MTNQEINEAVARKLGNKSCDDGGYSISRDQHDICRCDYCGAIVTFDNPEHIQQKPYCTSIAAAWEVMGYLAPKYFGISIGHGVNPDFWQAEIHGEGWNKIYERADTAPMAICLAFLKLNG